MSKFIPLADETSAWLFLSAKTLAPVLNCIIRKKLVLSNQTVTLILILVVVFCLWTQHQKIRRLQQVTDLQNRSNRDLQLALLQTSRAFNQQTELIHELVRENPPKDPSIILVIRELNELAKLCTPYLPLMAMEMESACKLLGADQLLNSAATMAKILENMFKDFFLKDEVFQKRFKKKTVNLGNLISYIEDRELFTLAEVAFLKELKDLRNEAAHEIAVRKPKGYLISIHRKCIDFIKCNVPRFSMAV